MLVVKIVYLENKPSRMERTEERAGTEFCRGERRQTRGK